MPTNQTQSKYTTKLGNQIGLLYVNLRDSSNRKLLSKFVILYINKVAMIADSVGYVPLPEAVRDINYINFNKGKTGTVFAGKARLNTKISDLLPKKPEYYSNPKSVTGASFILDKAFR